MPPDERIMVAMVTYPDETVEELDLAWLWPSIPRVGDHLVWARDGETWQATVWEVNWHVDQDLGPNESRVWLNGGTAARFDDVEPVLA